jgi:hypothetical protein
VGRTKQIERVRRLVLTNFYTLPSNIHSTCLFLACYNIIHVTTGTTRRVYLPSPPLVRMSVCLQVGLSAFTLFLDCKATPDQTLPGSTQARVAVTKLIFRVSVHCLTYPLQHLLRSVATYLEAMAPEPKPKCVVCGDPASSRCSVCKSDTYVHHYCGKACQTKDWSTHKQDCKELKVLTRVAGIVQQAFYDFRESTNAKWIVGVQDRGDALVISRGEPNGAPRFFVNFPRQLITDERIRESVLCNDGCRAAAAWMYGLLFRLLEGISPCLSSSQQHANTLPSIKLLRRQGLSHLEAHPS